MNTPFRHLILGVLLLGGATVGLRAQELTFLGGFLPETALERSSYTWQVDYRQEFTRNLAGSVAYINEGHLRNHHRDGTAGQLWLRLPLFHDRFAVAAGAGAYYFFDTQPLPGGDTADVHGTALIVSLSATAYLSNRWFGRFMINRISPSNDVKVNTFMVGAGFWFGQDQKPTPGKLGDAPAEYNYVTENEVTVFGGQSVVNTFLSPKARAYAAEYRRGLIPHLDWTLSGVYEGDPEIVRRSGVATQVWAVNTFFDHRIGVGVGLGPYFFLDHKHPTVLTQKVPGAIAPLVSLTLAARLSEHWVVRMVFDRVMSNYNRDSDIFLLGLGYRWPR